MIYNHAHILAPAIYVCVQQLYTWTIVLKMYAKNIFVSYVMQTTSV